LRLALILVGVCGLDATVVAFARDARFWAAVIPTLIPVLTVGFVIIPMRLQNRR
jgi:hypothetical protein